MDFSKVNLGELIGRITQPFNPHNFDIISNMTTSGRTGQTPITRSAAEAQGDRTSRPRELAINTDVKTDGTPNDIPQIWNPGAGGASSSLSAAEIQQQRFYQALLDSLGGRKQTASAGTDEKYNQGLGKIGTQRDIAFSNLDREGSKLGDQRKKALGQIQADTQNILQGANTTLGMYGAGNSSAADMAAFGAADLANKSNADATDQYNEQMGDISLSHRNTKREYDEEKNELDQWKRDQSRKLNDDFTNLENDFRGKIGGQANLDAVIRSFQDMRNPDVKVGTLADYKSDNISTQDLNGSVSTPTLTQDQAAKYLTPQNQRKKKDDTDINSGYLL